MTLRWQWCPVKRRGRDCLGLLLRPMVSRRPEGYEEGRWRALHSMPAEASSAVAGEKRKKTNRPAHIFGIHHLDRIVSLFGRMPCRLVACTHNHAHCHHLFFFFTTSVLTCGMLQKFRMSTASQGSLATVTQPASPRIPSHQRDILSVMPSSTRYLSHEASC